MTSGRLAGLVLSLAGTLATAASEHPDIELYDDAGHPVTAVADASESASCGQCHDSEHIHRSLSDAHRLPADVLSLQRVLRARAGIDAVADSDDNAHSDCSGCHGGLLTETQPGIASGADLRSGRDPRGCAACHGDVSTAVEQPLAPGTAPAPADLGALSGALLAGQRINASALNITDKAARSDPFDIHLARGLVCGDCHRGGNRPGLRLPRAGEPGHLRLDPRDVSLGEYLARPDHGLGETLACSDCHGSDRGHDWLPFAGRHLATLACESCHIPELLGPALASIDFASGSEERRGRDERGLIRGYQPLLLADGERLAPFNLIAARFADVASPTVLAVRASHGVVRDAALRDCAECHWPGGRAQAALTLGAAAGGEPLLVGLEAHDALRFRSNSEGLLAQARPEAAGLYLLGADQVSWADRLGMLIASATLAGVLLHGLARYLAYRRRGAVSEQRERVYMYSVYERFWHWLQAAAILGLLITGAAIHKPYLFGFLSFPYMVELHNLLGFILLVNALLAAFYHLASGEIKQYLPGSSDLFGRMFLQARYYTGGIFRGEAHPFSKDPEHKLNPLQQITYFGLLNTLLPAQIGTGILIWGAQYWPELADALGGLGILAPLHAFMAWLFAAFLIMHIYLTTTSGPKPHSAIKAMLEGWEDVEAHPGGH